MKKRKLLIGLATAGLFLAGFGASVLPSSADNPPATVTLPDGSTTTVTVPAAPSVTVPSVTVPLGGTTVTTPSVSTGTTQTSTTPAPTDGQTQSNTSPSPASPTGTTPQATHEGSSGFQQHDLTAKHVAHAKKKLAQVKQDVAPPTRQPDGVPTPANPTFSLALPGPAPIGVPNFFIDKFRIPPFLLPIYQAAGIQYGVRWELLAAINEIETDYGRNLNVSTAGAVGWMQFLPSTWKRWGVDANHDGKKDPYNPVDAIFSAARYLKAAGADTNVRQAIFAYNHASWYVDSVLLRAQLIGGIPADLIGSLTGLTQGHFPVHAKARYADDISESSAQRRIAKGHNAAIPVQANDSRTGINIYAKAGSPVVAVQDGRIVRIGHSKRLGRFIMLQDGYGNTYTYGNLKKISALYPVPKVRKVSRSQVRRELRLPKADPAPTTPASAGVQKPTPAPKAKPAVAATAPAAHAGAVVSDTKERLFAHPARPAAFKSGGQLQIANSGSAIPGYTTFKSFFTQVYGLKRKDVVLKPLRQGSQVIAGTILGRIGKVEPTVAPHVLFEIRPAGRGAPRVDPKPILDGWKLLESTAIYRAAGKNPFLGSGGDMPSVGQVLLMSKEQLTQRVLSDPNVSIYQCGRQDIEGGQIDRRVLAVLEYLSVSGLKPTVSALKCGHSLYTTSGNISEHSTGDAVDIAAINGIPIAGHQGAGSITDITIRRLLNLQGLMKPHQIISLMTYPGTDNTLALPDHWDHIHIGYRPMYGANPKLARQFDAVLKPKQWIKLIGRLDQIENPTVPLTPSKFAIPVTPPAGAPAIKPGD
ncbi:MAG TPA: lytic murein transglycosylase [Solirubrobacteraceae bacterium]|nr:lytic murein transglycosylase [Solirubrobacteraceae bacterium]